LNTRPAAETSPAVSIAVAPMAVRFLTRSLRRD
jgi:hypothetical protein